MSIINGTVVTTAPDGDGVCHDEKVKFYDMGIFDKAISRSPIFMRSIIILFE